MRVDMQSANDLEKTQANADLLGSIPPEIFSVEVTKRLSIPHTRKMREICKFFKDSTAFNGVVNQLSNQWKVFVNQDKYYFLSGKGHAYELTEMPYIEPKPMYLVNKKPIINIIRGGITTFYMDIDGDYHVSGMSCCGNLGLEPDHPGAADSPVPFVLPNGNKIKRIVAGHNTNFACDMEGNWYGFGDASEGQLTLSDEEIKKYRNVQNRAYRDTPTLITLPNNKKIVDVVTAQSASYFKDSDGQWFGCGFNGSGMLGLKSDISTVPKAVPLTLLNDKKIIRIVAGLRHAFFLDELGDWYGCGENDHGELGLNHENTFTMMNRIFIPEFVSLGEGKKIIDIVAGGSTSFFKVTDDTWYACGQNYNKKLGVTVIGNPSNVTSPLPVCLSNKKQIVSVIAGGAETIFLDVEGNWHTYGRGHENVLRALNMRVDPHHSNILNFDKFEDYVKELQAKKIHPVCFKYPKSIGQTTV